MASAPLDPDESRRLRSLLQSDRSAAARALSALPLEAQVGLVCDTPVDQRARILAVLDEPERVIPMLPEAELCFTLKAVGLHDAGWILEHATPEQIVAAVDLDGWQGAEIDLPTLSDWFEALSRLEPEARVRAVEAIDAELSVLYLRSKIRVEQRPSGDDGWEPAPGSQTLEGQFHLTALRDGDDIAPVTALLRALFEHDYWAYFRLMQGVMWELDSDASEWALRWRNGRLEDQGFPPWDEAMRIYRFIPPAERGRLERGVRPLDVSPWSLPIWIPRLPERASATLRIFRAIAELSDEERRACFYAFVALSNRIAVADRMPLSDAESTPRAIDKAAHFASEGLAHVATETGLSDPDVLRQVTLERLFAVGANLDPAGARP